MSIINLLPYGSKFTLLPVVKLIWALSIFFLYHLAWCWTLSGKAAGCKGLLPGSSVKQPLWLPQCLAPGAHGGQLQPHTLCASDMALACEQFSLAPQRVNFHPVLEDEFLVKFLWYNTMATSPLWNSVSHVATFHLGLDQLWEKEVLPLVLYL